MMRFHHENVSASRFAKFEHLCSLLGRPNDATLQNELASEFSVSTRDAVARVPFVPGAEAFLTEFSENIPLYLASVTPQADLDQILEARGLTRFFRKAYGCPPWTKPKAILDAMHMEKTPPESVVLIGDSSGDQKAAAEAGVDFIARDSGLVFDHPVERTFGDLKMIAEYLRTRLSY